MGTLVGVICSKDPRPILKFSSKVFFSIIFKFDFLIQKAKAIISGKFFAFLSLNNSSDKSPKKSLDIL